MNLKSKDKFGTLCCRNWSFSVRYFVSPALLLFFQGQVKDPKLALEKKEHLLLAVTKLMTKACPGAISLVLFLPKKSILGIGKAELHCRTSVSQETDELLLAMAMSPIYPSK